jgi:hypothetical protein
MIAMNNVSDETSKKLTTAQRRSSAASAAPQWHAGYLRLLPDIYLQARRALRHFRGDAREDALQAVIADTVVAYARLAELGREKLAYPSPLVKFAVAKFHTGRLVGCRLNGHDVTSKYCQRRTKVIIERPDCCDGRSSKWQEILVEDQRATPADIAAIRIDFEAWLSSLNPRERRVAETLATGESTARAAKMFDVTAGRVSQLRTKFRESWNAFVDNVPTDVAKLGAIVL